MFYQNVIEPYIRQTEQNPDQTVARIGGQVYSYAQLAQRIAPIMKALRDHEKGQKPENGCIFIGSKGMMASLDPYGNDCILMLNGEKEPRNTKVHEACSLDAYPIYIPRVPGKTDEIWIDMDREQTGELCRAIRGQAKCFSA